MDLHGGRRDLVALALAGALLFRPAAAGAEDLVPEPTPEGVLRALLWSEFRALPEGSRPRVGLALGGGGARGLAHVGVLRAFEDEGIPVDVVAGTSIGAFVGALYATGAPAAEVDRIGRSTNWNNLSEIGLLSWPGIFSSRRLEAYVNALLRDLRGAAGEGEVSFADLRRRFACVAADLATGEEVVFDAGPVAPAVRASCAVPGLFEPYEYGGRTLIDGGVVNNLPTDLARRLGADVVVAVDVAAAPPAALPRSPVEVLVQVIRIQGERITAARRAEADAVVRPDVGGIGITELERADEAIRAGLDAAAAASARVEEAIIAGAVPALLGASPAAAPPDGLPIEFGSRPRPETPPTPALPAGRGHREVLARARAAAAALDWAAALAEAESLGGLRGRAEAHRIAAAAALRLGRFDVAFLHADAAVRADDRPAEAWVLLAVAALGGGREGAPRVAVAALAEAARRGRAEPFWRAWALEAAGDAGAEAAYREAAAAGSAAARVRLAWAGADDAPRAGVPAAARVAAAFRLARSGDRATALARIEGVEGRLAEALRAACSS